MSFFRLWFLGYVNPAKMVEGLRSKAAPHWGVAAQLVRGTLDASLLYLPLYLMGKAPPMPSNLSIFPTDRYYGTLVWLAPIVFIAEMLMQSAVVHVVIRLAGRRSDFDQIVNISGMAALVVGAVLLPWDWLWFSVGGVDQYFLGYSHPAISLWAVVLTIVGLKRILDVPVWLGVLLSLLAIPIGLPFAIMFMRSPL